MNDDLLKRVAEITGTPYKAPKAENDDVSPLLERMRGGVFSQESGSNYKVKPNARTGATGGFQVMPDNIPAWTQKHLKRRLTRDQFENDPQAQEDVFSGEMGEYLSAAKKQAPDDDTAIRMAAAAWYGGKGAMHRYDDPKRFRPNEPSFREYTSSVLKKSGTGINDDELFSNVGRILGTEPDVMSDVDRILGSTRPVPETAQTLELQTASVLEGNSPKAGILFTNGQENQVDPATLKALKRVERPEGVLYVNANKAPDFDKRTTAELIGKIDDVKDTSKGDVLVTTDDQGNELSSSIVTPESADKQAELDRQMYPQAAKQGITDIDEAVKLRQQQTDPLAPMANIKEVPWEDRNVYSTPSPQAMEELSKVGESAAKGEKADWGNSDVQGEYAKYLQDEKLADSNDSRDTFNVVQKAKNDARNFDIEEQNRVNYNDAIDRQAVQQKTLKQPVNAQKQGVSVDIQKQIGKPTDDLNRVVKEYAPKKGETPRQAAVNAVISAGVTRQQAEKWASDRERDGISLLSGTKGQPIQVPYHVLAEINGEQPTIADIRSEQSQAQLPSGVSKNDVGTVDAYEAERNLEGAIKDGSFQNKLAKLISEPWMAMSPFGAASLTKAPDEKYVKSEKDRLLKEHGSMTKAWKAEQYYQNADYLERGVRMANQTARSFGKNLLGGTAKSALLLSDAIETLQPLTPDKYKVGLRNAGNVLEVALRTISGDKDPLKYWQGEDTPLIQQNLFKAVQEFDKAVGDDPVLKGRFIGSLSEAGGSALAFVAMGAVMPSLAVTKFGKTIDLGSGIAGGLQSAGAGYEEAANTIGKNGSAMTEEKAKLYGAFQGLVGASEMLGAGGEMVRLIKSPSIRRELAEGILQAAGREGKQEFGQEVFQTASGKAALEYLKDNDPSTFNKVLNALNRLPKQLSDTVANEGLIAIITGSAMGGATGAAQTLSEKDTSFSYKTDTEKEQQVTQPEIITDAKLAAEPKRKVQSTNKEINEKNPAVVSQKQSPLVEESLAKDKLDEGDTKDVLTGTKKVVTNDIIDDKMSPINTKTAKQGAIASKPIPIPNYVKSGEVADKGKIEQSEVKTVTDAFKNRINEVEGKHQRELAEAYTDDKTKLANQDAFEKARANREATQKKGEGKNLRTVVFDIIGQKDANSGLGFTGSDEAVLKPYAKTIKEIALKHGVPERDIFRAGGDEFAIHVENEKQAKRIAIDVKKAIGLTEHVATEEKFVNRDKSEGKAGDKFTTSVRVGIGKDFTSANTEVEKAKLKEQGGKGSPRVVTVNDKEATLTPEQAKRWEAEVDEPLANAKRKLKRDNEVGPRFRQQNEAEYKGTAMQIAAVKRQITGRLTYKESSAITKRQASNFIGKEVSVDGKNGKVISNPFGRTKVEFEDGSSRVVEPTSIQPASTKLATKKAEIAEKKGGKRGMTVVDMATGEHQEIPLDITREFLSAEYEKHLASKRPAIVAKMAKHIASGRAITEMSGLYRDDPKLKEKFEEMALSPQFVERERNSWKNVESDHARQWMNKVNDASGRTLDDAISVTPKDKKDPKTVPTVPESAQKQTDFPTYVSQKMKGDWYVSNVPVKGEEAKGAKRINRSDFKKLQDEYDAQTLAKVSDLQALSDLKDASISELSKNIDVDVTGADIDVHTLETMEIVRQALDADISVGFTVQGGDIVKLKKFLDANDLKKLKAAVTKASSKSKIITFAVTKNAVDEQLAGEAKAHETSHRLWLEGAVDNSVSKMYSKEFQKETLESPLFKNSHIPKSYKGSSKAVQVHEFANSMMVGEFERLNIDPVTQKKEILAFTNKKLADYEKVNGAINDEAISKINETANHFLEVFRESQRESETTGQETSRTTKNIQVEPPAGEKGRTVDEVDAEQVKKSGERSFPKTLREAGLSSNLEDYAIYGNKEAIVNANKMIDDLGLDKTIKTLENAETYDKTLGVVSHMVQKALLNEAALADQSGDSKKATEYRTKQLELADKHSRLHTEAGQFTQSGAMVAQSAESVVYRAESIAKTRKKPLSVDERSEAEMRGRQAEKTLNEWESIKNEIRRLKAQVTRLKSDRVNKRSTAPVYNKTAIERAKTFLPDVQALIKSIRNETLSMKASTGDSNILRMAVKDEEPITKYGASLLLDKQLSEISRDQFEKDIRKVFNNKFDDVMPQVFAESFNLRQELLNRAKKDVGFERAKERNPGKTDAEVRQIMTDAEAARKERIQKGVVAKKLANLYDPQLAKQTEDLIDIVHNLANEDVADYAERILTKEVTADRANRKLHIEAERAIRDAKVERIAQQDEIKKNILGGEEQLREFEREEFLKRNELLRHSQESARMFRKMSENPVKFYAKEGLKILGESRSILASGDFSAALRQGFYFTVANPMLTMKGDENVDSPLIGMFKSLSTGKNADLMKQIENHPNFDIMLRMGIEFAEAGANALGLTRAEENIRTEYAKKIPVLKQWMEASERTYSGFLDLQRAVIADQMIQELQSEGHTFKSNREAYEAVGKLINIATGRGDITSYKPLNDAINTFGRALFAPRYAASRFQLLAHVSGKALTLEPAARKIAVKRAMRFHTAISLPLIALIAAGIVAFDPDDDDFLKIRIGDKARYEVTGGLQGYLRYLARMGRSVTNLALGNTKWGKTRNELYYTNKTFWTNKLNPVMGYGAAAWSGKEPDTSEFHWLKGIWNRIQPISFREIGKAAYEDGALGFVMTLPTISGIGVGYYPDREKAVKPEDFIKSPAFKRMTTDDVSLQIETDTQAGDVPEAEMKMFRDALTKKATNAIKAGTFTQEEADRVNKILGTNFKANNRKAKAAAN